MDGSNKRYLAGNKDESFATFAHAATTTFDIAIASSASTKTLRLHPINALTMMGFGSMIAIQFLKNS
jgi:hypothetical protein